MKTVHIEVHSVEEAWNMVDKLFPTDYMKDDISSANAGYPVYRSTCKSLANAHYNYICDLNTSIEINLCSENWDGKTIRIHIINTPVDTVEPIETPVIQAKTTTAVKTNYTEKQKKDREKHMEKKTVLKWKQEAVLRAMVEPYTQTIIIRTYENGNSRDTRRAATDEESKILFKILYGAISSINFHTRNDNGKIEAIINGAEFTGDLFIPDMNGYNSVYIPLKSIVKNWEKE